MSPLLLCLAEEVLCRGLSRIIADKKMLNKAGPEGYSVSSHILYADDIFVFFLQD